MKSEGTLDVEGRPVTRQSLPDVSKNPVKEAYGRGTRALELLRPGLGAGSPLLS